jgi:membrane associated rhomboid family serine protease
MNFRASTIILILNVLIFFGTSFSTHYLDEKIVYSLICWSLDSGLFSPYQLLTSIFLHSDLIHLTFNMLLFSACAEEVEDKIGEKKFVIFYLLCGIMGTSLHLLFSNFPVIGASGAIWGILVMWAVLSPEKVIDFRFLNFKLSLRKIVISLFILEVLFLIFDEKSNVSNLSHIGGASTGLLLIIIDKLIKKEKPV